MREIFNSIWISIFISTTIIVPFKIWNYLDLPYKKYMDVQNQIEYYKATYNCVEIIEKDVNTAMCRAQNEFMLKYDKNKMDFKYLKFRGNIYWKAILKEEKSDVQP